MKLDLFRIPKDASIHQRMLMLSEMFLDSELTNWRQAPCHPESPEAETWGSGRVIATKISGPSIGKDEFFAKFSDSPPMILTINALNSVEPLMRRILELEDELEALKKLNAEGSVG